jgi:hypothetical protein
MRILIIIGALLIALPASAQDKAKDAALTRFMKAMSADASYTSIGNGVLQSFVPLIAINQQKQAEVEQIIQAEVVPELKANRTVYTRALRAAYAKRFTTAELNSAAAFIESPIGQKMRLSERDVQVDALKSLEPLQKKIQTTIAPRVLSRMKAAGLKTEPPKP